MHLPKSSLAFLLMPFLVSSAYAQCDCIHNGDAGRWNDSDAPNDRIAALCAEGGDGGCYQAQAGLMCVRGDVSQCGCAVSAASQWQSWHGDWFLWSSVTCSDLYITIE